MNNSPNNDRNASDRRNSSDHTYNLDFEGNAAQTSAPQRRPQQTQRPPMTDEERRRIAAARAAGMRMNSSGNAGMNGAPRPNPNGQSRPRGQYPTNGQRPVNGPARPNPNSNYRSQNPNYPNPPQRRPNPQQRPPESFTGRKRKRKIQINAGAVIFVLLIGAVVGVSVYQISKNPEIPENDGSQTQYEEIIQNAQNSAVVGDAVPGQDSLENTTVSTPGAETDDAGLLLYDTVAVQNSTMKEGQLVLVNYNYAYEGIDDVTLKNAYNERTGKIKVSSTTLGMEPEAFDALEELVSGLVADTGCDDLLLYSGHRTLADQQRIWDSNMTNYGEEYTKTYVAVPGHSEHHTGLACDLGFYTDEGASIPLVDHEFGTWVWEHCTEYGYILRYPADKADITGIGHEQWHFRYVGLAHAYAVDALGLCYEEYVDALKGYAADTKMLHISAERELTDVNAADISTVSGGWLTYFVPASEGDTTDIRVPRGDKYADYEISGNNVDGFIVTITLGE